MIDKYFPLYAASFAISFLLTLVIGKAIIPILAGKAQQPIYAEGPDWHLKKSGTPTMGGISFLCAITLISAISASFLLITENRPEGLSLICCAAYALLNSVIGIIDDATKLKRKRNAGLTPAEKLILQFLAAILFLVARHAFVDRGTALSFSFGELDIGPWYYPLSLIILVGITNCANLTDGIDGLAGGVAFATSISLFYISCALSAEISLLSAALIGGTTGFLIFNLHPARVFMGDTGSLYLGSLLAASAVALGNPLIIVFIGAVYVAEGVSVIIQVGYFKLTRRRIFKMAPLHHHLEKCGWSENKICIVAIILTFIASIPAYALYLP